MGINCSPVEYCINIIKKAKVERKGKNWYASLNDEIVTVNAKSYTIITAHKTKKP